MAKQKTDRVHSALKWVSNHRYTALAVLLILPLVAFVGCSATAKSPVSGKSLNADALLVERDAEIARLRDEGIKKSNDGRAELARLEAEYKSKVAAVQKAIDDSVSSQQAAATRITNAYAAAGAEIEEKQAMIQKVWDVLQSTNVANSIPGGAIVMGLAGSVFGLGAAADNKRKNSVIAALKSGGGLPSGA